MDNDRATILGRCFKNWPERWIIGRNTLNMAVQFDATQTQDAKRSLKLLLGPVFTRQNCGARDNFRKALSQCCHKVVERCSHPWLMGVEQANLFPDPSFGQEANHLFSRKPIDDLPGMAIKPAPNRVKDPLGEKMNVVIDDLIVLPWQYLARL